MSVITRKKPESEVRGALMQRGDLAVVVVGCDKCAKTSKTGGSEQVRAWKQQLRTGPAERARERQGARRLRHRREARDRTGHVRRDDAAHPPERSSFSPCHRSPSLRPGILPQLQGDIVMHMSAEDVNSVFRVVMDDDREEAMSLVRDRLYRQIKRILERPRCSVAFEMERKLAGGI